jgi:enamine deaminase RidA (YjgF/YER057c/UK114 family)
MPRHLHRLVAVAGSLAVLGAAAAAVAADIVRIPLPNSNFPISQSVHVPTGAETIYFSGITPPLTNPQSHGTTPDAYGGNTPEQSDAAFQKLGDALKAQGLDFGNIVSLRVYLVADPVKDNKMDFLGFQSAYIKYFGTETQPNKPARTTVQVAGLAAPGALVEIEATAAK